MYKVRVCISKLGFRKLYLEGVYVARSKNIRIKDMKEDCARRILLNILKLNNDLEDATIEIIAFKKIRTDFVYGSQKSE